MIYRALNQNIYNGFIPYLDNTDNVDKKLLFERIDLAANKLNEIISEKKKTLKKLTIPFILYTMDNVLINKISITKYSEWLNKFLDEYDSNEDYRKLVNTSGTASKESVLARKDYFTKAISNL